MSQCTKKFFGSVINRRRVSAVILFILSGILISCRALPPPGIGQNISWSALPGWSEDSPAQAWPALLQSCQKMPQRDARWKTICDDAALFAKPDDDIARAFFETRFSPHEMIGRDNKAEGLITGYYEPLLHGSLTRSARYRYPLYGRPDDLVTVELGELYPELKGKRLRGRLNGQRVVPYYSRSEIAKGKRPPDSAVLAWVDDPVALFFLEVQGSGKVQLPDGRSLLVGYADQNGHPYIAIGRTLVDMGVFKLEEATLPNIREWLITHPDKAQAVLNSNPSYVFFNLRAPSSPDPVGALDVPLVPERSVAVDPSFIPLGSPIWLDTSLPANNEPKPYRRLVFAQDTGGAIKGPARADLFLGFGAKAEQLAGAMRQPGKLYVLQPLPRFN